MCGVGSSAVIMEFVGGDWGLAIAEAAAEADEIIE